MDPNKLRLLYNLAKDERTPLEERKNAALQLIQRAEYKPRSDELESLKRTIEAQKTRIAALEAEVSALKQAGTTRAVYNNTKISNSLEEELERVIMGFSRMRKG